MKPIEMKKPENSAISPRPPYGELEPSWGTSCSPTPNTTAQSTNSMPKNHLPFGPVIRLTQRDRPSAENADFAMMNTSPPATPAEMNRAGRLFGKFSNQRVKIVTLG